jgi:hypothetical protein
MIIVYFRSFSIIFCHFRSFSILFVVLRQSFDPWRQNTRYDGTPRITEPLFFRPDTGLAPVPNQAAQTESRGSEQPDSRISGTRFRRQSGGSTAPGPRRTGPPIFKARSWKAELPGRSRIPPAARLRRRAEPRRTVRRSSGAAQLPAWTVRLPPGRVARFIFVQNTKTGKMYQITLKFTKLAQNLLTCSKIDRMAIKYANIFHCKTLQNLPSLEFWV